MPSSLPKLRRRERRDRPRRRSLTAVHADHLTADPGGEIGGEKNHHRSDVVGRAESLCRDILEQLLPAVLAHRLPLLLGCRIGAYETRRDVVDGDVPGAEFMRELARQPDLASLGAGIGLNAGEADAEPGTAGDVDDAPIAALFHAGGHGLRHEEGAGKIDVENRLPIGLRDFLQWSPDLATYAAGVVDENIHRARIG